MLKFVKKRFQNKCFPVDFQKVFKKTSLQNSSMQLILENFAFNSLMLLIRLFGMLNVHS